MVLGPIKVMGVLNVTPDSFSDGGVYTSLDKAFAHAQKMIEEGAAIIDIGGESARPGAQRISVQEELDRVMPVLENLRQKSPVAISVDTSKPAVMREVLQAGADMINDIRALQEPGALEVLAQSNASVCLMHMQGTPQTMQHDPRYDDVVGEIKDFFAHRIQACEQAGIDRSRIIVDPGFGFGKSMAHNLSLLKHLDRFQEFGVPLLMGLSRKSTIGAILDDAPVTERLYGSLAAAVIAAWQGAQILRVHDVKPTVQALQICYAVQQAI
jgi:dihydropteroate synthase